jgi:hypothetical protein
VFFLIKGGSMKRIFIILCVVLLSIPVFALDLELGPCVFLNFPIPLESLTEGEKHIGIEDLVIGADVELMFGILQLGAIATFSPAAEWEVESGGITIPIQHPAFITLVLDGGILIKVLFLRLGLGAGPTMRIPIIHERPDKPIDIGINVKGNVDLVLGGVAVRLNLATYLDLIDMAREELGVLPVYVGISVLFDLI